MPLAQRYLTDHRPFYANLFPTRKETVLSLRCLFGDRAWRPGSQGAAAAPTPV